MKTERKNTSRGLRIKLWIWGVMISTALSLLGLLLVSLLTQKEYLPLSSTSIGLFIHGSSVFLSVQISSKLFKYLQLSDCLITAALYTLLYTALSVIFFDGITIRTVFNLMTTLFAALGSFLL